jgi:hypothetical protein
MKNHHVLKVKFLGATNTKGIRIRITSERFEASVILPLKYNDVEPFDQAIDYLLSKDFNIIGKAEATDGMYIITDSFHNIK